MREPGWHFANPLFTKTKVSTRVRNFETGILKVNDRDSNPIEIAAVVVWRVVDTAEALFEVDNYLQYVQVQSEAALRGSQLSIHTTLTLKASCPFRQTPLRFPNS